MNTTPAKLLALAALLPLCASAQVVTTLLNDNFNDNNRANQDLPGSAQWFAGASGTLTVTGGPSNYALQNAPSTAIVRHVVAYFAAADTPVTLASAGDKISVAFDLTPTSASPAGSNLLRIALLHSGAARLTGDANTSLALQSGYGLFINTGTQVGGLYNRTTDSGALLSSLNTGNGWAAAGTGVNPAAGDQFGFVQNTTYRVSFTIEREADALNFTYSAAGGDDSVTASFSYSTVNTYDFDTVAFGWGNAFGTGLIDNVLVTYSPIPEPSSVAALVGLTALVGAGLRRRRRQAV